MNCRQRCEREERRGKVRLCQTGLVDRGDRSSRNKKCREDRNRKGVLFRRLGDEREKKETSTKTVRSQGLTEYEKQRIPRSGVKNKPEKGGITRKGQDARIRAGIAIGGSQ